MYCGFLKYIIHEINIVCKVNFVYRRIHLNFNYFSASPKWILQPSDVIKSIGSSVTAQCSASGSPLPQVTWFKKSGMLNNFDS